MSAADRVNFVVHASAYPPQLARRDSGGGNSLERESLAFTFVNLQTFNYSFLGMVVVSEEVSKERAVAK